MKADTLKIADLLRKEFCYTLPLFQRKYVWTKNEWGKLWEDIKDLHENPKASDHFIGSVVSVSLLVSAGATPTYMLIDGQQRLTTIFIILVCLRDIYKKQSNLNTGDKIHDWLTNRHVQGQAHYKLLPTEKENDQAIFRKLIDAYKNQMNFTAQEQENNNLLGAKKFFAKEIATFGKNWEDLLNIITERLCLVSITLELNENPSLVFESLNSTGRKLYASDLIRNYFFMRIPAEQQTDIYNKYWSKIEEGLEDEELTDFIRHYLQKDGVIIKMSNIYIDLKTKVGDNPIQVMEDLLIFASYYKRFLAPNKELNLDVRYFLQRLKILDNTTAYPFLLNCFHATNQKLIDEKDLIEILRTLEILLLRRFFCKMSSNILNKYFPFWYKQAVEITKNSSKSFVDAVKNLFATISIPSDADFKHNLISRNLYGVGASPLKTKLLLASIDQDLGKKDKIDYSKHSIEHIMPQTLNDWWKNHLGIGWETIQDTLKHNLGNLTLTMDNGELSNKSFLDKRDQLKENSRVLLNKYFEGKESWKTADVQKRAEFLADKCLKIWPLFAAIPEKMVLSLTGTTPIKLTIKNKIIWAEKQNWKQVLISVAEYICKNYAEKLPDLMQEYPSLLNKNALKASGEPFISPKQLKLDLHLETHGSAETLYKSCRKILEFVGISETEWNVNKVLK